jgi:DNA-binding MarR family transcriptional regulator
MSCSFPSRYPDVCVSTYNACVVTHLSTVRKVAIVTRPEQPAERFTEIEGAAWGGLLGVHGRLMRVIDRDLAVRCGIGHPEFEILLRLSWADGHRARIQDLAAASVLTRSGTSRAVERLERLGLISRETAQEDRRGSYAILLPAGADRLEQALDGHVPLVRAAYLGRFTSEELEAMAEHWRRVEAGLAAEGPDA